MAKLIVAISAWKGSGKDTAADYLVANWGFKRIGFADPLKDNVAKEFGISRDTLDLPDLKEKPIFRMPVSPKDGFSRLIAEFMFKEFRFANGQSPEDFSYDHDGTFLGVSGRDSGTLFWTPRALAILEGSTKRSANANHWVQKAAEKAEDGHAYVISDLRYKSEMKALSDSIGPDDKLIFLRINRFDTAMSQDPSERDLDDVMFKHTIENRGSLTEFFEKLKGFVMCYL